MIRLGATKKIHFTGIGGAGMSAIAEVLIAEGYSVSGSDLQASEVTRRLAEMGARISIGHAAANLPASDVLVYSSAVADDNPELQEARRQQIPVIKRAEMLSELMRHKYAIAVAGTHGKTTTASLIGAILCQGDLDPTLVIGGRMNDIGGNARAGSSDYLVAEADEYDRSFLKLSPTIAVLTNIEAEHLNCYASLEDMQNAFIEFANRVPFYGTVIAASDDPGVRHIAPALRRRVSGYGFDISAETAATAVKYHDGGSSFQVHRFQEVQGEIHLKLPGKHNVANSLAGLAVGFELDIPFVKMKNALEDFGGIERRFEIKARENEIIIVDDYAHHPTEVAATLAAAASGWPQHRLIAVFQPHLYSRTREFYRDFAEAFQTADALFVTDVYPAREAPIAGVSGKMITDAASELGHSRVTYVADKTELASHIYPDLQASDMVIVMGAGDIWQCADELAERLKKLNTRDQ